MRRLGEKHGIAIGLVLLAMMIYDNRIRGIRF